jgi:hypothetical protein
MKKVKVTIRRKKWLRGTPSSSMCNKSGAKCCLGFIASACGIDREDILEKADPADVVRDLLSNGKSVPDEFMHLINVSKHGVFNSKQVANAIELNDEIGYTPKKREKELKKLLNKIGYDVTFTD